MPDRSRIKEGRKAFMEKDLKEKKPSGNNDPKIPWPKLIPAAAVIAALVFSGIKAQGSDENTETLQKADTTVMSASELEKYLGYEEGSASSEGSSAAADKKSSTKKSSSKKSTKKTAAKKSSGKRTVSESAKSNASAAGQGSTQTPVANVPANGYKDGTYEGSGTGFGGTITVRVTVSGGKITAIDILDASGETGSYFALAKGVISRMIAGNTPNVDDSQRSNLFFQRNYPGSSECFIPGCGRWKYKSANPFTDADFHTNANSDKKADSNEEARSR